MAKQIYARKPLALLLKDAEGERELRRVLGPVQLTGLGVGMIIGAGIFVVTGDVARDIAGPSMIVSFIVAAFTCAMAALCYAELAAMAPVAGSAYTYAYATLGELMAWIIGWDLILEYSVAAAAVAHGASDYFQNLMGIFKLQLPAVLTDAPFDYDAKLGSFVSTGKFLALPALLLTAGVTVVLVRGIRESARFNTAMVILKVAIVIFVIILGAQYVNSANWYPFAPNGWTGIIIFGKSILGGMDADKHPLGMLAGAATIFFAYIGFDSVSTHAEEAIKPKRDVPVGIIASLLICTVLYMALGAVFTGMIPRDKIATVAPVANAFAYHGLTWAQALISFGAVIGITSVMLVTMLSQARILLAMARDGLLPRKFFGAVHERFRTPWKATILTGIFVALLSSLLPRRILSDLVNIGTLLAFVIVCAAVLILRKTNPDTERPFRVPFVPLVPIAGILTCLMLMFSLPAENWLRLVIWLLVGFAIYFAYGRKHSITSLHLSHEMKEHGVSPAGSLVTHAGIKPDDQPT
jgi:APA family basic amino acid/polyamine antiporter